MSHETTPKGVRGTRISTDSKNYINIESSLNLLKISIEVYKDRGRG